MPPSDPRDTGTSGRRGLLTEHIARQLEQRIRTGEWAVGAKLPSERELAVQFGASRNVIREVLRRLEATDLIEVAPGRGSFAAEQSSAHARGHLLAAVFGQRYLVAGLTAGATKGWRRRRRAPEPATPPDPPTESLRMKIVDAKVVVTSPGRNFVTFQITTTTV